MSTKITSDLVVLKDQIAPQSVAASGTAATGWIDVSNGDNILTEVVLGALGGGSVAMSWQQATDTSGTGAKTLSLTGGSSDVDDATIVTDDAVEGLDIANGFMAVKLTLTNTGGTGALVSAAVHLTAPRYA